MKTLFRPETVLGMAQFYVRWLWDILPVQKLPMTLGSSSKAERVASPPGEQILPFHPLLCLSDNEFLSPCIDILITEPEWGRLDHQQPANWECQKQRECGCRRAQEINLFSCCGFRVLCWCHSSLYRCCFKLTGKIFPFSDPWSLLSTW